jgi:hypothetical protein
VQKRRPRKSPPQALLEASGQASNARPEQQEKPELKPGQRRPDGRREPPPPAPKRIGPPIPIQPRYDAPTRLNTRSQCEKEIEHIVNWMKVGVPDSACPTKRVYLDPNRGNAMVNGIRAVLQSKTATEDLELKVSDREMLRRMQEMEEQLTELEEYFMQQQAAKGQGGGRLQ